MSAAPRTTARRRALPAIKLDPIRNPVLGHLPAQITDTLIRQAVRERFPAGSCLMREGTPADAVFFILSGEFGIFKGDVEIDRQSSGGVLGEMGVLTGQTRTATVRCLTEVETLRVTAETFLGVIDRHPEVLRALISELVGKVQVTHTVRVKQVTSIQQARDTLSRCVSVEVLDQILERETPEQLLSGRLSEAAILFYDIKGFSAAAESMEPKRLLQALNEHLQIITDSVAKHRGTVINFIGDAVLAVFNCPIVLPDPASAALSCYEEAREGMKALQRKRRKRRQICFQLGAGLNYGKLVSGAIGSETRFSYTVIGDEVNLAARLESLTRHYPVELILSDSQYRKLPPERRAGCVLFDRVRVKGRKAPTRLYTLMPNDVMDRKRFEAAVRLYLKGQFEAARKEFATQRGLLAGFLGNRCKALQEHKVAWRGYFSWEVK